MLQFDVPAMPPEHKIIINEFRGVNLNYDMTTIADNESPNMWNIDIDEEGIPDKRVGFTQAFEESLGPERIDGIFKYRDFLVVAHGNDLYKWDGKNEPIALNANITPSKKASHFIFLDKFYFINGHNFLVYDGESIQEVDPYIPTIMVSTLPNGAGEKYEDLNLIGTGFTQLYSPDGEATEFRLILDELDDDEVIVELEDRTLKESEDFTVNRETGYVTFNEAPKKGINILKITAHKTHEGMKEKITKCTIANIYGGQNDTRVHLSGNPDEPEIVRRCGLNDPSYWPENDFDRFSTDGSPVMGFANQYYSSIVLKRDSLWIESFYLNEGLPTFTTKPLNRAIGIKGKNTIQIIENNPVFVSDTGVMELVASNVPDERNVRSISDKVNRDLLKRDVENAISYDFKNRYILAFPDGTVWVYNYSRKDANGIGIWYPWNNIYASCFIEFEDHLYFGSNTKGMVYRFKKTREPQPFNDCGEPIKAKMDTKAFTFTAEEFRKMTKLINFSLRPSQSSSVKLSYATDRKYFQHITTEYAFLFAYNLLNYSKFSYLATLYPVPIGKKLKTKKIVYFQLRFENNELDESMGLMFVSIKYRLQREVR